MGVILGFFDTLINEEASYFMGVGYLTQLAMEGVTSFPAIVLAIFHSEVKSVSKTLRSQFGISVSSLIKAIMIRWRIV